jgi:hypothetical protein
MGATMQNLVLSVQNNVRMSDMGAASAVVAFFRTMGGSIGVSVLGALLSHQVATQVTSGYAAAQRPPSFDASSHAVPNVPSLPGWEQAIWESAFGESFGHLFLVATPFALVALVCVLLIKEVPLRTSNLEAEAVASPEAAAQLHHAIARDDA